MLAVSVYKVAHSLGVVELRLVESAFNVANLSIADLFNELVPVRVQNEEAIVGRVCNDEQALYTFIGQRCFTFSRTHSDNFAWMTQVLPKCSDCLWGKFCSP